jgi:hypothetical protein
MNSHPVPPPTGASFLSPSLVPVSLRDPGGVPPAVTFQVARRPFKLSNADGILEDWTNLYLKELMIVLPDTGHAPPQLWPPYSTIFLEIEGGDGLHFSRNIEYIPNSSGASGVPGFPVIVNVVNQERPGSDLQVFPRIHKDYFPPGQHLIGQNGRRAHRSLPSQLLLSIRDEDGNFLRANEVILLFNVEVGKDITGQLYGTLPQSMQRKLQSGI